MSFPCPRRVLLELEADVAAALKPTKISVQMVIKLQLGERRDEILWDLCDHWHELRTQLAANPSFASLLAKLR